MTVSLNGVFMPVDGLILDGYHTKARVLEMLRVATQENRVQSRHIPATYRAILGAMTTSVSTCS
jgi:hypothetical protein